MYHYRAYGLTIDSSLSLPELLAGPAGTTDIVIYNTTIAEKPLPPLTSLPTWRVSARVACASYPRVGIFRVADGHEIQVELEAFDREDLARPLITGPMLGLLLHQRGLVTLHGSCVALDQQAVCFLAPSTGGKSTMASVLCRRGYTLLADDITAISTLTDHADVVPAFPQLKLWPDALEYLGQAPDALPRVHPDEDKRLYIPDEFASSPYRLTQIYILEDGHSVTVCRLTTRDALMELLRHSYCADIGGYTSTPEYFQKIAALARLVPVYRLTRPQDLRRLPDVADLVDAHLQAKQRSEEVDERQSKVPR